MSGAMRQGLLPPSSRVSGVSWGGGRGHHQLAHRGRAGEQQVIEGEGAERGGHLRIPLDDRHLLFVEHAVQQLAQHGIGVRGEFG